ncbi:MAG: GNAT family N-acetyltransferase [Actinomycetota bacterium]
MTSGALGRIQAFERSIQQKLAERTVASRWGTFFLNDAFDRIWDLNGLRVMDPPEAPTAAELEAEVMRVIGLEGRTPKVYVEDAQVADDLTPGFEALGWSATRLETMVLERAPAPERVPAPVEEVTWETLRPLVEESTRRQPYAEDEEDLRQLVERATLLPRAVAVRYLMARVDGAPAAYCHLYSDGATAQVEEVATLAEFRGRGLARAVITAAVRRALQDGHDLVFLVADADDWPRELYGRLGFESAGRSCDFYKRPQGKLTSV